MLYIQETNVSIRGQKGNKKSNKGKKKQKSIKRDKFQHVCSNFLKNFHEIHKFAQGSQQRSLEVTKSETLLNF